MVLNRFSPLTARQAIDQALEAVDAARAHQGPCKNAAGAAATALDGCEEDITAIKFDRPERDVSANGRAIRTRGGKSLVHEREAKGHQDAIGSETVRIDDGIKQALVGVGLTSKARFQLEEATRDLDFMKSHDIKALESDLRIGARNIGPELDPFLREVESDAPGRDVGRFAEDIKRQVGDGNLNFREAGLAAGWVLKDLNSIQGHLELARQSL